MEREFWRTCSMSACQAVIYRRCSFCFFSSVFFFWCFFWHTSVSGENLNRRVMLDTTPVSQILIYDTAPCLRHTPRITPGFPRLFWHGVEISWKLSCTENDPVPDEMRCVRLHRHNVQTGAVSNVNYDTGVANTLFTTPRNVHDTRLDAITAGLACCRATIQTLMYAKRSST